MLVKNFLFHRVSEEKDKLWPPMTPALFERIIQLLTKRYTVIGLENFQEGVSTGAKGRKLATVMFDDGFKDNIEYAAPILKKHNCQASFYVVTNCIDKNIPTWTYLLDHALQHTRVEGIRLTGTDIPTHLHSISLIASDNIRQLKPWIKSLSNMRRIEVLDEIHRQLNDVLTSENKMMNWNDIRQLKSAGFHIGSHSHTHPMLGALEDEAEILEELTISSRILSQQLGEKPVTISYPIGSFDQRVIRLSKQAGYKWGLAVEQKFYDSNHDDMMAIPRVELYQEPLWKVKLRVSGIYQKVKKLWP
jgi:peptidoglycan/xylan/chitin deacetylase (PgdA/CDA1 family)